AKLKKNEGHWTLNDVPVAYEWQIPLWVEFASRLNISGRRLVEIGYGMGLFSKVATRFAAKKHIIIEAHPLIAYEARQRISEDELKSTYVIEQLWQDSLSRQQECDAIMYDAFSVLGEKYTDLDKLCCIASNILAQDGAIGFFCAKPFFEERKISIIDKYFEDVTVYKVTNLTPSPDFVARGVAETMLVPIARRPRRGGLSSC
ncbi:MAG: hypothetical protein RIR00_1050, partial [Pseudomonadota bacterium]